MSMRLSVQDLDDIKATLVSLNELAIHAQRIVVKDHVIFLEREQSTHYIVGIDTKKDQPLHHGPMRGSHA